MRNPIRVLSVSSSRSDVGIVAPIWKALAAHEGIDSHIFLTGMQVVDDTMAREAIPASATVHSGGASLGGRDEAAASVAMADIHAASARLYAKVQPDVVIVVGDRLDMLPGATAALPYNIPLAHVAGGDLTLGAIDDRVRHALTKLSHLHFAVTVASAARICRMGEEPWRIHVTGAPNLDTLVAVPPMSAEVFVSETGLPNTRGLRLVTIHPETNAGSPLAPMEAILAALECTPAPTLFTAPNADPGGDTIQARIRQFANAHAWAVYRDTLGSRLYANAMRHASVMVGNSSSGIIEAAVFGLNVINVGSRQDGRVRGTNVHDAPAETKPIVDLLSALHSQATGHPSHSLYGDGHAGQRIAAVLASLPERERLLYKRFHEKPETFRAPWHEEAGAQHGGD